MPINFQTSFIQPVLAELDAGKVRNATDWAKLITRYYVATIKTGAPQGIPFTLPAPALLGAAYPIGNTFYNTIDAKSRFMENIIKAYFLTEELKVQKGGIKGLIQTGKQLALRARELKTQIKSILDQIKQTTRELKELPQTLTELYEIIRDDISQKIKEVQQLGEALNNFILESNNPSYEDIFRNEINLINNIKNFNYGFDLQTLQQLTTLLSLTDTTTAQINSRLTDASAFKAYITQTLTGITKQLFELVNTAVSPVQYLTTYQQLAQTNSRAKIIYEKLKRIEYVEKKVQPKLIKLENDLKDRKNQLENRVQLKIDEVKKDIEERIKELEKRRGDGKDSFYKKAKKTLGDYKKKYKEVLKEKQQKIKKYINIGRSAISVVNKASSIVLGVEQEIQNIKDRVQTISDDATDANKQLIEEFTKESGLSEVSNILTQLVVENKLNAQQVKELLLGKSAVVAQYYNQLVSLVDKDIPSLLNEIRDTPRQQKAIERKKETSFIEFYNFYKYNFRPQVTNLDEIIKRKTNELKKSVEEKIDGSKQDLTQFGINLIPVKSDKEDKTTKKLELEEKKRLIEDKKKKLKRVKDYIRCGKLVTQGATQLGKNFSEGQYFYSKNQQAITRIADGYFDFKSIAKNQNQIQAILQKKKKFNSRLQDLALIENLIFAVLTIVNEVKSDPNFFNTWKTNVLDNITDNNKLTIIQTLGEVLNGTVTNPKDILDLANKLTYSINQDIEIIRNIATVEQRYTQKALQLANRIAQSKTTVGEYFKYYIVPEIQGTKSVVMFLFNTMDSTKSSLVTYVNKFIDDAQQEIRNIIRTKKEKIIEDNKQGLDKLKEKAVNVKAGLMGLTFSLATRTLWSGATWIGPTGTIFTVTSIGPFKPIKAQVAGGASALITEIARGFETQLKVLTGTYSNPGVGIPPAPFIGYK